MSVDIHISNYEEFLYSYVDGELSPEEATALEAFVAAHPQVRAELDQLLATKLPRLTPYLTAKPPCTGKPPPRKGTTRPYYSIISTGNCRPQK